MHIPQEIIDKILSVAKIEDVIADFVTLTGTAKTKSGKCPMCGKEGKGKGIQITVSKQIYKCFSCDMGGNSPVKFLMETQKMDYPTALKYLADKYLIEIPTLPSPAKLKKRAVERSFKNKQLEESGLTVQDVKAVEYREDNTKVEVNVFEAGTVDEFNRIVDGDDMIIHYLDLYGKRIVYKVKESDKQPRPFYRVRWQVPESHPLKSGDICKYKTPYGASTQLYIPQTIRNIYHENRETKRLFFTEGEKKAEKMCKHGLPAFGMAGINSFVGKNKTFPDSVAKFIERCNVKEVFIVLDSDFLDLSNNITPEKDITQRSRNFFYAVKNFRDWFRTLVNRKIFVEVYFIGGKGEEKGIDDLLVNRFTGKENEFTEFVNRSVNGIMETEYCFTDYFELYKISTISDLKLSEIWSLNDRKTFCFNHFDILKGLPAFKYGKNLWKYDGEEFVLAQPLYDDEKFWKEVVHYNKQGEEYITYHFNYVNVDFFYRNRGYYRMKDKSGKFYFVYVQNRIIQEVTHYDIRDFVLEFTRETLNNDILEMLKRNAKDYFGPDRLSQMFYYYPEHFQPSIDSQHIFFKNKSWKVSAEGIEEKNISELEADIFIEQIKNFEIERSPRLVNIKKIDESYLKTLKNAPDGLLGKFDVAFSDEGKKCHFADFLYKAGNFYWQKYYDHNRMPENEVTNVAEYLSELSETNLHFLSKMSAIGYLLHKYRNKSSECAIIAMDGRLSESGDANGRSGKSLVGKALEQMLNQVIITGSSKQIEDDKFLWEEVTEKTENVFIDDIRAGFDLKSLFNIITGMMTVNPKNAKRFTLREHEVPKFYITTNYSIKGLSGSFKSRQFRLAFSDFFDVNFIPFNVYHHNFFTEWDKNQWNLFYNFMAECLEFYFVVLKNGWGNTNTGLLPAPTSMLEKRQLKQEIGEMFLGWFNEFLSVDDENYDTPNGHHLNRPFERKSLFEEYIKKCPSQGKHITPQFFWKKLELYCRFWGFRLNPVQTKDPEKPQRDKRNGIEYITIANQYFEKE
jgi:hypothetical protein